MISTDDGGHEFKTVFMKNMHPVRVKYPLSDEMLVRVKSMNPEMAIEELAPVFADICIDRQFSEADGWKRMLSEVKNMPAFLKLFQEAY